MPSTRSQPFVLAPSRPFGLSLTYRIAPETDPRETLKTLARQFDPQKGLIGLGLPLVSFLSFDIPGLRPFPAMAGPNCSIPSTQGALWFFLQGEGRSDLFDESEGLEDLLSGSFLLEDAMNTFVYAEGRDLSGYVDGTENPDAEQSPKVALVGGSGPLSGSSFVAVQRWVHDLTRFRTHSQKERDRIIGREQRTNREIPEAPISAHIKRSAQEAFSPAAFMVRRSMPWATGSERGLEFVAFGQSFDAFERVLRRMSGGEDGIVDALFSFSRPVRGGYYWCPPVKTGRIDLAL